MVKIHQNLQFFKNKNWRIDFALVSARSASFMYIWPLLKKKIVHGFIKSARKRKNVVKKMLFPLHPIGYISILISNHLFIATQQEKLRILALIAINVSSPYLGVPG